MSTGRTAIVVAVIGVFGSLGAAAIANWDRIFSPADTGQSSGTGSIASGSTEATSADRQCVPEPRVPGEGALLHERRLQSGKVESSWMFGWKACPGAQRYHLFVIGVRALNPIVDDDSITSATHQYQNTHYASDNVTRWSWKVRAFVDGEWGSWSDEHTYRVAPPN